MTEKKDKTKVEYNIRGKYLDLEDIVVARKQTYPMSVVGVASE